MQPKIIVLDDDPTGSQTVHSCLLLTTWEPQTIELGWRDDSPLFFVLTNTRSMSAAQAAETTREVCRSVREVVADERRAWIVVSRSDSTLRGHYPIETDAIAEELGPFDAHFLTPEFFEGGRITRRGTHYVVRDGREIPAHETEFARDSVFAYSTAYLPDYVEEKTGGRIPASEVELFEPDETDERVRTRLLGLSGNACCAVSATTQAAARASASCSGARRASGPRSPGFPRNRSERRRWGATYRASVPASWSWDHTSPCRRNSLHACSSREAPRGAASRPSSSTSACFLTRQAL